MRVITRFNSVDNIAISWGNECLDKRLVIKFSKKLFLLLYRLDPVYNGF